MEKNDIASLLAMIASLYPNFSQSDANLKAWYWLLKDESKEEVTKAVKEVLKISKYPPVPAEIFDMIKSLRTSTLPETISWSLSEALANCDSPKYLCRIAKSFANRTVPKINGKRQFSSPEELHKAEDINRREWERAFKDKFKELQEIVINKTKIGINANESIKQLFIEDMNKYNTISTFINFNEIKNVQ